MYIYNIIVLLLLSPIFVYSLINNIIICIIYIITYVVITECFYYVISVFIKLFNLTLSYVYI